MEAAQATPGMRVLDLACGSGAPSIPLAKRVAPGGSVVGLDLSAEPLKVARRRAQERGLQNVSYLQGNAQVLPFAENSFDRVTCRFGAMFLPDAAQAFREAWRVLRPGGRIALTVWGAFEQPYFASTAQIVMRHTGAVLPPTARAMFRFAEPESLASLLRQAGFTEVASEPRTVEWLWPGRPQEVWEYFQEATAPMRPLLEALRPEQHSAVERDVLAALGTFFDGENVRLTADIVIAIASRT